MLGLIGALIPVVGKVLDRVLPDTEARDKAKAELTAAMMENAAEMQRAAASVVLAEAQGESWLQRNWRPMLMVLFGFIVANNYVLVPWLRVFGVVVPTLDIPPDMWSLLSVGVGGYVVGRSAEKVIEKWKGPGNG